MKGREMEGGGMMEWGRGRVERGRVNDGEREGEWWREGGGNDGEREGGGMMERGRGSLISNQTEE